MVKRIYEGCCASYADFDIIEMGTGRCGARCVCPHEISPHIIACSTHHTNFAMQRTVVFGPVTEQLADLDLLRAMRSVDCI
jgi:hypothetical protein